MTSKQRAKLRGLANTMETILHVGKGGVTEPVINQAKEALEAREIFKGAVLDSCATSATCVAVALADACGAEVVQVIGHRFVLYKQNPKNPVIKL